MKTAFRALALAASLLISGSAMAVATTVVASDTFDTYTAGTTIAGQNGGTGFASGWTSGAAASTTVVGTNGANSLQFTANSNTAAARTLSTAISGDVLVSFSFQYTGVLGNNDFLAMYFGSANSGNDGPNIGLKANCTSDSSCKGVAGDDGFVRTGTTSYALKDSDLVAGTTYVLFGHLYKTGGSTTYNNFDAWLNPTAAEMLSLTGADAHATGPSSIASFSTIGFRTANVDNGVSVRIDNLQVSLVPEPASVALFGAALLGMGALRRRRG